MQYGHFDNEHREYVIDRVDLPVSWTNYLGLEDMTVVMNHTAGGYMFYKSPEYHRITRFRANSVPMDRPGHYIYIRDNEDGDYWSVSWQPVGKPLDQAKYTCRHGMSYSVFESEYKGIKASQKMSVPLGDAVELWDVKVKNDSDKVRSLSLFSYAEFSYHHIMIDHQNYQMSLYCAGASYEDGIIEEDLFYEEFGYQYFASSFEQDGFDCMRDHFLGNYHTEDNPERVINGKCRGTSEKGGNHCATLQKNITLAPGEEVRLIYFLGEGRREEGRKMREKYSDFAVVDASYEALHDYWEQKFQALQIHTPNEGMNTLINTWTLYQAEINVMFSRFASFIEVGGRVGLGYRDTAQDSMTIPHSNPEKCRERIEQLLRGLVTEGYGLHLFQPEWFETKEEDQKPFKSPTVVPTPDGANMIHGIKDACSDDALWLVSSIVEYIKETGDLAFAEEQITYADTFMKAMSAGEGIGITESVYDHCKRILDFSARQVGMTGICKGLRADWNDCLNLGGGESAMVSFLHYWALNAFIELASQLRRAEDVAYYTEMAEKVRKACNQELWDGEWFIRGITAKGCKIGTQEDKEGRVHLESNAWAILSGAAEDEKATTALEAIDQNLFTQYGLLLNTPSYTVPDDDIGFVTRVYPGLKENGAIFSHPNPWAWAAACKLGRGDIAMKFYDAFCPYNQNDKIEIRESEPYSYCQFIAGRDHTAFGRARHPLMTGTGGWAYFSATRYMLGIRPDFEQLVVDPCIPADWKEFSVDRRFRGAMYHIHVTNPNGVMSGVKSIQIDGRVVDQILVQPAGSECQVEIQLG